jgi:hypothetical protein
VAFLTAITALMSSLLLVQGQSPRTSEYQLKAVFLFNFMQFVDWPPSAPQDSQPPQPPPPLLIGVLGDDPFGTFLDETVRGERVGARPIQVRRYRRIADIEACNILFISRSESEQVPEILSLLKNRPVLTVSDGDEFASQGGMIQFFTDKNRIRIRINLDAAEAANLTISSKLLRVAEVVRTPRR